MTATTRTTGVDSRLACENTATWNDAMNMETEQQPIPPTDTGKAAWVALALCTAFQIPIWGFPTAFGVFQEYYSSNPGSIDGVANIAVVGTTMTGILYLSSPFTFAILSRWPRLRPWFGPIGLSINFFGFLLSSYATTVGQLIATQSFVCGLGSALLFTPTTLCLDEWFVQQKGLAYGIMWSGKSVAGVGMPFIMGAILRRYGPAITLQVWSVASVLLSVPLLYYLQPRIPVSQLTTVRRLNLSFTRIPAFWMLTIGNIFQSLGYFLPYTYLYSYAVQDLGLTTTIGTLLLASINTTSIPGGIVIGSLGDRFPASTVILISSIGSVISVVCFWGLAQHIALLTLFTMFFGFFAGGFSSTWGAVLKDLQAQAPALDTGFVFGLLAGGRGIGNVISGPLSVALIEVGGLPCRKDWGFGSEYGLVILFTGVTGLLGAWGCIRTGNEGRRAGWRKM